MKILSGPEGDELLTNAEVQAWLKDKNFEVSRSELTADQIKPPSSVTTLARDLRRFLESSPSGNETLESVRKLFDKLDKYNLSPPELMMIANIRPEAYAHLTPLIADVYSRFDEDQLYEMLQVINSTLEKRNKPEGTDEVTQEQVTEEESTMEQQPYSEVQSEQQQPYSEAQSEQQQPYSEAQSEQQQSYSKVQSEEQHTEETKDEGQPVSVKEEPTGERTGSTS